jgi:hypothetical protein
MGSQALKDLIKKLHSESEAKNQLLADPDSNISQNDHT